MSRDSFRFLKTLPQDFTEEGAFPHQTADLRELSWEVELNREALMELTILDYPGEIYRLAFLDAKDDSDSASFRQRVAANKSEIEALLAAVKGAEKIFVLFNLADGIGLGRNPANLDAVWVTNACLHLLKKLDPKPDIQLLLTQVDIYLKRKMGITTFSLDKIDLVGHDHADIPWRFVSVVDAPESKYGIDSVVSMLVGRPFADYVRRKAGMDIDAIDFKNCIRRGADYSVTIDLSRMNPAILKTHALFAQHEWLQIRPEWKQEQSDWEKLSATIVSFNNAPLQLIDVSISPRTIKSQWGWELAKAFVARITELQQAREQERKDNLWGFVACIVMFVIIDGIILLAAIVDSH